MPVLRALNAPGGEKQYMEQPYDVKRDVEELADVPVRECRRAIGKTGRMIGNPNPFTVKHNQTTL